MQDTFQLIGTIAYFLFVPFAFWGMFLAIKGMIRNERVYKLRRRVADLSWQHMERTGNYWANYYYKLPSYASMMLGKEPVRLESYYCLFHLQLIVEAVRQKRIYFQTIHKLYSYDFPKRASKGNLFYGRKKSTSSGSWF